MCQGSYRNAVPRSGSSEFPSYNFEDKLLLHDTDDSRSNTSWQSEESSLCSSAVLFSIPLFVPQLCLYQLASICKKTMRNSLNFLKSADDGSPGAGRPSTKCPDVPNEFRVSGCKQESRQIIPLGHGVLMGWLGTWDNPELRTVSRT